MLFTPRVLVIMSYLVNFLCSVGFNQESARQFIAKYNGDEKVVLNEAYMRRKLHIPEWKREQFGKMIQLVPLRGWFELNGFKSILHEISLFEVELIQKYPLYLFHAFQVPIKLCVSFAQLIKCEIDKKCLAFSYATQIIKENPNRAVPQQEMHSRLYAQNLELDISHKPFGQDPLRDHELWVGDLIDKPYCDFCIKYPWQRLAKVREKKTCEARIYLNSANQYIMKNNSKKHAQLVLDLHFSRKKTKNT